MDGLCVGPGACIVKAPRQCMFPGDTEIKLTTLKTGEQSQRPLLRRQTVTWGPAAPLAMITVQQQPQTNVGRPRKGDRQPPRSAAAQALAVRPCPLFIYLAVLLWEQSQLLSLILDRNKMHERVKHGLVIAPSD